MWQKLDDVFREVGLPYFRQGSFAPDAELPDTFFTYWNEKSEDGAFFDNLRRRASWKWRIYIYAKKPSDLYSKLDEFADIARLAGFSIDGDGSDAPSSEPGWFARTLVCEFSERRHAII